MTKNTIGILAAAVAMTIGAAGARAAEWNLDTSGNWTADGNWVNPATFPNGAGAVADFSQLDISAPVTVTLGQNITVGSMTIGDTSETGGVGYTFTDTVSGRTLTFNQDGGASLTVHAWNAFFFATTGRVVLSSNLTVSNNGSGVLRFRGQDALTANNNTLINSGAGSGAVEFLSNVSAYTLSLGTGTGTKIIQDSPTSELRLMHGTSGWDNGQANQGVIEIRRGTFRYGCNRNDILGDATDPMTIKLGNGGSDAATYVMAATTTGSFYQPFELVAGGSGVLTIAADTETTGARTYNFQGGVTGDNSLTVENRAGNESLVFSVGALNFSGALTHIGAGTGTATINSVIGANVTGVEQNSATSVLTLNGANTYTGPTTITAGTLALGSAGSLASELIDIASGAIFDVSAVTSYSLGNGQRLAGAGSITGDLEFGAGSTLTFSTTDTLTASSGTISFASGFGIADLFGLDGTVVSEGTYTLISGTVDLTGMDNVGLANRVSIGGGKEAYFASGSLNVVVVPEPATLALAACGLGLATWHLARRRKG